MTTRARLLAAGVAGAALAGHVAFWYLPRDRAAALDATSGAGALFVDGPQQVRVWIAHPHQNLGAAARAMHDPAAAFAAAARLAGLGEVALPAFGPFALPPSDALAMAVDPDGENLAVVVEVYPAVALLARVAGLVAGNPILRGGTAQVSGGRVRVFWRGRLWSLDLEGASEAAPGDDAGGAPPPAGEALAFLALETRQGVVDPGTYRLRRDGADLVLESEGSGAGDVAAVLAETLAREHGLAFLGFREEPSGSSVLVLPRSAGAGLELPGAAVAWTGGGERWSLPGEGVQRLLGLDLIESRGEAWNVAGLDRESFAIATRVAPELGAVAERSEVTLLAWLRPRDYLPLVAAVAEVLDALPIAPRDEVEHWNDLRALLEAVGPLERVRISVAAGGGEARLGWGPSG